MENRPIVPEEPRPFLATLGEGSSTQHGIADFQEKPNGYQEITGPVSSSIVVKQFAPISFELCSPSLPIPLSILRVHSAAIVSGLIRH